MTNITFIEQTKNLEGLVLTKIFVKNVGWIEMKEDIRQLFVSLISPLSIYEFMEKVKKEEPEEFSNLIAFEVAGKNIANRIVRKVFTLPENSSALKSGSDAS